MPGFYSPGPEVLLQSEMKKRTNFIVGIIREPITISNHDEEKIQKQLILVQLVPKS
jgi:hypothetical protein